MDIYSLKSSSVAFCSLLVETLHELNYVSSKADPDVYIPPAVKPNGFEYDEYVLCYVNEILSIYHCTDVTMDGIRDRFTFKYDKVEEPTNYLVAQRSKMKDEFGNKFWTMSPSKYCKAAITKVEERLALAGKRLPTKCKTPMVTKYAPDMDVTTELKANGIQYFQ